MKKLNLIVSKLIISSVIVCSFFGHCAAADRDYSLWDIACGVSVQDLIAENKKKLDDILLTPDSEYCQDLSPEECKEFVESKKYLPVVIAFIRKCLEADCNKDQFIEIKHIWKEYKQWTQQKIQLATKIKSELSKILRQLLADQISQKQCTVDDNGEVILANKENAVLSEKVYRIKKDHINKSLNEMYSVYEKQKKWFELQNALLDKYNLIMGNPKLEIDPYQLPSAIGIYFACNTSSYRLDDLSGYVIDQLVSEECDSKNV